MSTPPEGQRFSHVYLRNAKLLPDSNRMRRRLAVQVAKFQPEYMLNIIRERVGILAPATLKYAHNWPSYFEGIELRDVLDIVTLRYVATTDYYNKPLIAERSEFLNAVAQIFSEEEVQYRIDHKGGVHLMVDAEFENARTSAIAGLGGSRYEAARTLFESAHVHLDRTPPDGKAAVRGVFSACENLFRLMFPSAPMLNTGSIRTFLKPAIDGAYAGQKPALHVAQKQLAAFEGWVDAAHFYRHEPGTEEPSQPPLEIAIYLCSQGAALLRWMAHVDNAMRGADS